jgi:hypothetical protein
LPDQDAICDTEVDGDRDNHGDEPGPGATGEVCDVADEPDEEEEKGDGLCVTIAVVFDELRYQKKYPTG